MEIRKIKWSSTGDKIIWLIGPKDCLLWIFYCSYSFEIGTIWSRRCEALSYSDLSVSSKHVFAIDSLCSQNCTRLRRSWEKENQCLTIANYSSRARISLQRESHLDVHEIDDDVLTALKRFIVFTKIMLGNTLFNRETFARSSNRFKWWARKRSEISRLWIQGNWTPPTMHRQ